MHFSLDALEAFSQAASSGSFSAAARKLGKSQSTISEAIAKLEIDLGVNLFDRQTRQPTLTEAGKSLLCYVEDIFSASDQLNRMANQLANGLESHLTLVLSDTYQTENYRNCLAGLNHHYPTLAFECIIAEHSDVLNLVSSGRADLGLVVTQPQYTPDIAHATINQQVDFGLFVANQHPLTSYKKITHQQLAEYRLIDVKTTATGQYHQDLRSLIHPKHSWSASNYLLVLEMVVAGFGWSELPHELVNSYASNQLTQLNVTGWPYSMTIDIIWSRRKQLGQAGHWLLNELLGAHKS